MPEWLPVIPTVSGLFGCLFGVAAGLAAETRKDNGIAIAVVVAGFLLIAAGIVMFQFTTLTREECTVVGTSAENATYVCVEVTE